MKKLNTPLTHVAIGSVCALLLTFFAGTPVNAATVPPTISTSVTQSSPLNSIAVSGSNFAPNESVRISLGLNAATVTADNTGSFTNAALTVPAIYSATHTITAVGLTSGSPAYTSIWVSSFSPQVTPSTYYSFPGSTLTFSGTGFAPNETVTVSYNSSVVTTTTANSSGSFTTSAVTIPYNVSNTISYTINGQTSLANIASVITLGTITPYLQADAYSGNPGDVIHIQGFNFAGNEGVTLTAGSFSTTTTANSSGTTGVFAVTLPYKPSSLLHVTLQGQQSLMTTTLDAWIGGSGPQVSPSTYYIQPGSSVTFTGSSFAPNETVNVSLNNSQVTTVQTSATGAFTLPYIIPLNAATAHFVFSGASSNLSSTVDITLAQFYSSIQLSTYWAQGGSPFTITGSQFGPNESVALSTPQGTFATVSADASGAFVWNGGVPFGPSGAVTITAKGTQTNSTATSPFTLAPVWTGVWLSNYGPAPASTITVNGSGYLPNEKVNVTSDRTGATVIGTVISDSSGNLNGPLTIPTISEGNLTLTFTSEHSFDSKQITIYVTGM